MDKNFINIDDLVRQRLTGGEEREPAGAWLRMSELLEKEMPKRPVGFAWRRLFGGMAVLALISVVGLGGYKMSSFRNLNGSEHTVAGTVSNISNSNAPVSNTEINNATIATNTAVSNSAVADNKEANKNDAAVQPKHHHHKANDHKLLASNTINNNDSKSINKTNTDKANNTTNDQPTAKNNDEHNNTTPSVAAVDNSDHKKANKKSAKTAGKDKAAEQVADKATVNTDKPVANNEAANTTEEKKTAEVKTTKAPAVATKANKPAPVKKSTATLAAKNNEPKADNPVATTNNVKDEDKAQATENTGIAKTANNPVAKKQKHSAASVSKPADKAGEPKTANVSKKHKATAAEKTADPVSKDKLVLSSGAPTVKTENTGADNTTTDNNTATGNNNTAKLPVSNHTGKGHKAGSGTKTLAANTPASKPANKIAVPRSGKKVAGPVTPATPAAGGGANTGSKVAMNTPAAPRGTHVIQRMIVNQRLIPGATHPGMLRLDTISIENVTEEFDLASAPMNATNENAAAKNNTKNDLADDTSPLILSTDKYSGTAKDANSDNSKGKMALDGLNAAFNDIKYKAGHAQFSAGIAAGINGTFFGPNNFKGFQFGLTGRLAFSDALSLLGELKYFHRINNDYTLNDDYYRYTPVSGGYTKELVKNPYGISTLHSIEMPISIQYAQGDFNFFVGPNVSYQFSINTGDYPMVVTSNTVVSSVGNDNTPKIKTDDFGSRIGLGYLVGVSYQVSPRMNIDIRDVQTFWDNSKTTGGKYISSQLYRSPSFQLSIGYRFGGNKHKE
jgi:hypothetical protein